MGLIPLLTSLPIPNGWLSKYAILRWERLQNFLKGMSYTKNQQTYFWQLHLQSLTKCSPSRGWKRFDEHCELKEDKDNVLSKSFHLCLPLDFILDIWGTFSSSRGPTQEWDALGCVSHCVLVLSDTTSSQQISAVSSTTASQPLLTNSGHVGIPPFPQHTCTWSWGAFSHGKPAARFPNFWTRPAFWGEPGSAGGIYPALGELTAVQLMEK